MISGKRIEIAYRSKLNELNKLNERLIRAEKALSKKRANAEKLGVAEWTSEDRQAWLSTVETAANGFLVNKADEKKNEAWFNLLCARETVKEAKEQIEKAEARFEKAEAAVEEYHRELEAIEGLKAKEELQKLEFDKEQKEWGKDGIALEGRYYGITPSGKKFYISGNCGSTRRSLHCFTLTIDGQTIFTSGEFWRAYGVIRRN